MFVLIIMVFKVFGSVLNIIVDFLEIFINIC